MTKARNIADLLDANGDVKTASLDNVPASNDASALTTGTLPNARLPNNISDGGTEGTKIATGTTAQRGTTAGQLRFNSDTGLAEYYTGTVFKSIDSPPTISSVNTSLIDSNSGSTTSIVITGSNYSSGATVTFVPSSGSNINADSVTVNSGTQITAVVTDSNFVNANEPYSVKVENASGLSAILASAINVDTTVAWQTSIGSLGTISDNATGTQFTVSATDADSDTITYSVLSGSLPSGLSLNSNTGAISGDPTDVSSASTSNFTLRASTPDANADRTFSITVNPTISAEYLIVAGGGGGTREFSGGGAGGYRTNYGGTKIQLASGTTYTATVGAGGNTGTNATNGGDSLLSGSGLTTITSTGGGGGTGGIGQSGGSGAGGAAEGSPAHLSGSGNTPSTNPSQGNDGGDGYPSGASSRGGGGGGGHSATGNQGQPNGNGNGGNGTANSITGSSITYAGGGAGAGDYPSNNTRGSGGSGGGGGSGNLNGTDGLGGGGGAYGRPVGTGGTGGDGIVILRLPTANYTGTVTGSPTVTTTGTDTVIKFTGTGTYTA